MDPINNSNHARDQLPTRSEFLAHHITPLSAEEITRLRDPVTLEEESCLICRFRELSTNSNPESEHHNTTEKAVRLPCGHCFGQECLLRYLSTKRASGYYYNRCPFCQQALYKLNWWSHRWKGIFDKTEDITFVAQVVLLMLFTLLAIALFSSIGLSGLLLLEMIWPAAFGYAFFEETVGVVGWMLSVYVGVLVFLLLVTFQMAPWAPNRFRTRLSRWLIYGFLVAGALRGLAWLKWYETQGWTVAAVVAVGLAMGL
jgi:Ring finger domain